MKYSTIITAGGTSSRFGDTNKLLEKINGKEVIKYTVEAFLNCGIDEIIICANKSIIENLQLICHSERNSQEILRLKPQNDGGKCISDNMNLQDSKEKIKIIEGGASRQASVYNGLKAANCDYVLIHDGARPLISPEIIENTMQAVAEKKAVSVMTKTIDTIKEVDENGKIIKTIDRSKLFNTQTPQAFEYNLIKGVHEKLQGQNYTDDAGMVEALGYDVYMVEGDYKNIKVTTKSDIALCEIYLKSIS